MTNPFPPGGQQAIQLGAAAGQPQYSLAARQLVDVDTDDPVTVTAAIGADINTAEMKVRNYLNSGAKIAAKWVGYVPTGAVSLDVVITYTVVVQDPTKTVRFDLYGQKFPGGEAASAYSSVQGNDVVIATTASRPEDKLLTFAISDLNLQAGALCNLVFSRDSDHANDNLAATFAVLHTTLRFY